MKTKHWAALIVFFFCLSAAWVSGFNFDTRGYTSSMLYFWSIWAAAMAYTFPWDK